MNNLHCLQEAQEIISEKAGAGLMETGFTWNVTHKTRTSLELHDGQDKLLDVSVWV